MDRFEIAGFTHTGRHRQVNQDRLMFGNMLLSGGFGSYTAEKDFYAFVADGVGGSRLGEFAAQFVMEEVLQFPFAKFSPKFFQQFCQEIQEKLKRKFLLNALYNGSATTLTGFVYQGDKLYVINAGDADARILVQDKWTELNQKQIAPGYSVNAPITSYFGGDLQNLFLQVNVSSVPFVPGSTLLLCSDGLWLATDERQVADMLKQTSTVAHAIESLYRITDNEASRDNVTAILIEYKR